MSTYQVNEKIILNKVERELLSTPSIPEDHTQIAIKQVDIIDSDCWREYVGTWEIKERKLFLKDISGKYVLKSKPVFADWYTGLLTIPESEPECDSDIYFSGEFNAGYKKNKIITVVQGNIIKISYQDTTLKYFTTDSNTQRANRMIASLISESTEIFSYPCLNNKDKKLVIIQYDTVELLERNIGKVMLTIQNYDLPIEVTADTPSESGVVKSNYYSLILSAGIQWVQEIDEIFGIDVHSDTKIPPNACFGSWVFDKKNKLISNADRYKFFTQPETYYSNKVCNNHTDNFNGFDDFDNDIPC